MRRALLIGSTALELPVTYALDRMRSELGRLEFSLTPCAGASRDETLACLDRWISTTTPDDDCLLYYYGHAGQLRFTDLPSPSDEQRFGFLTTAPESRGDDYGRILDIELSTRLTRLDRRCANVTAILDCCHAGELVRSGDSRELIPAQPTPAWARMAFDRIAAERPSLAIGSHPRIARLTATTALRQAHTFAEERGGESLGHFTRAFIDTLASAGEDWSRLTWELFVHAVRERVFAALGMESQWVSFAGPRTRRLFSREEAELQRVVGFVVDAKRPTQGWLRAGLISGVHVGDRFDVLAPTCDAPPLEGEVVEVEINRARLALSGEARALTHCCAALTHPLLSTSARASRLPRTGGQAPPLRFTWGLIDEDGGLTELPLRPTEIDCDARLWLRVAHLGAPPLPWFVSVVLIDPTGQALLLNSHAPEGLELMPDSVEHLGLRHGRAQPGLSLPSLHTHQPATATLLLLACRRPIELAHLVDVQPPDLAEALTLQGLDDAPDTERSESRLQPPVLAKDWHAQAIELRLRPCHAAADARRSCPSAPRRCDN